MTAGRWLDEVLRAAREPLRVVCRTQATARAVLRELAKWAETGGPRGFTHLEVTTLDALMAQARPRVLRPAPYAEPELPKDHPWRPLLEDRPGLRSLLRRHAERVHAGALAGATLEDLRPELRAFISSGWGRPELLEGAARLLAPSRLREQCLAVGFASSEFSFLGAVGPLERALLRALQVRWLSAGDPLAARPGPIPALAVPDVAAEARAVALEVRRGSRVLVLVPDTPSEERVLAALARNGIAVADDAASPLERHALVAILEPLLPLFGSRGTTPLDARHLLRLCTDPVLSRSPPRQGIDEVSGLEDPQASILHVRDLLGLCRRHRATLDEWLTQLFDVERKAQLEWAQADPDGRSRKARWLASGRGGLGQLRVLAEWARGAGTLAESAGLVTDLGLAAPETDRLGRALVASLESHGQLRAEREAWAQALAGALSSGRVDRGVEVLTYASYDGRDSDLLILTGVHDKGLARAPAPDPFLNDSDLQALGLPTPRQAVAERLALARWAASRAGRTLALVSDTDATSRRVSPPVELELSFSATAAPTAFGLSFDLPETRDCRAFGPGEGPRDREALQADAEWARQGARFGDAIALPSYVRDETLAEKLEREGQLLPAELGPWLGLAYGGEEPALRDGFVLSASRLQAFTQCLYRAFCESALGLEPIEPVTEDLDAREVGTAAHLALEQGLKGVSLLVPAERLAAEKLRLLERLRSVTSEAIEQQVANWPAGADSAPLAAARQGLAARWARHWEGYLERRLDSVETAWETLREERLGALRQGPTFLGALEALAGPAMKKSPKKTLEVDLFRALCVCEGSLPRLLTLGDAVVLRLAACHQEAVRGRLRSPEARPHLELLCLEATARLGDLGFRAQGDLEHVGSEVRFGAWRHGLGGAPLEVALGRGRVALRGSIDAVFRRHGNGKVQGTAYHVVDYKTGYRGGTPRDLTGNLTRPQLALYALALEAMGPLDTAHPAPVTVERIELDYVRSTPVGAAVGERELSHIRSTVGALLDKARDGVFPVLPHPECCPLVKGRGAFCDFQEICRMRPWTAPEEEREGER